ncbi:MAG: type I 3-dehydroquinate dehydratase [Treponema sp.]|jgi:3-dehydroquinate dehydratase/shikimate dehydrogenase|nr:type I 3-dehydroquinate dehydratase [Treponema sp.]
MARICLCLTGKTLARNLEILDKYRKYVDLAELRVDCLEPDERFLIRRFPEMAGLPLILTIRRDIDGGNFSGGEGSRIILFSKGLAFADADRRRNFAYVDIEEDLDVPSLEEAARTFGTRIIRSYHNLQGVDDNLARKLRSLSHVGDEIVKVAVSPRSTDDVLRVYRAAGETADLEKILLCMGPLGISTRILAAYMSSYLSYTSVKGEPDLPPGAPGQLDPGELAELYRFRQVSAETRLFGIVGFPLRTTSSPRLFNAVFTQENLDALYVPFPSDSIHGFLCLAEEIGLTGVSVTVPYKEAVLPYLARRSEEVESVGACNTLVFGPQGWIGYNTDTRGFSDSLLEFIGKKDCKGKKVTIIGAGGAARAVAAEIYRLKGKALILNRTVMRARELAMPYRFLWGTMDGRGIDLMSSYSDIIIQTTPVGMEPDTGEDPLALYRFLGHELVMDLIYKPERTMFLKRAAEAGCRIRNGYDMLIRQAKYQYHLFLGKEFPSHIPDIPGKFS